MKFVAPTRRDTSTVCASFRVTSIKVMLESFKLQNGDRYPGGPPRGCSKVVMPDSAKVLFDSSILSILSILRASSINGNAPLLQRDF